MMMFLEDIVAKEAGFEGCYRDALWNALGSILAGRAMWEEKCSLHS